MSSSDVNPSIRQAAGFTKSTRPSVSTPKIPSALDSRMSRVRSSLACRRSRWAVSSPSAPRVRLGLLLGLPQQFLRAQVAPEDLQAHPRHRQQLVEQRLLVGPERPERGEFHHAQERVAGKQRPRGGLRRRGLSHAGGDPAVARGQIGQRDRPALACALADQPFAKPERFRRLRPPLSPKPAIRCSRSGSVSSE